MAEWKRYTGAPEQIKEMLEAPHGFLTRGANDSGETVIIPSWTVPWLKKTPDNPIWKMEEYLICEPHPLAEMICSQAQTGQPVYWKAKNGSGNTGICHKHIPPFAHPGEYEYSFSPFE